MCNRLTEKQTRRLSDSMAGVSADTGSGIKPENTATVPQGANRAAANQPSAKTPKGHLAELGKVIPYKTSTFQYDNQGNLLREERKAEGNKQESIYSYDGFNRQKKIVNFENKVQVNHYDGEGLRHEMEENGKLVKFLYADREAVAEEKEDGNIIRFIRGYDLVASDSENARTYYHYASDEQGSITHVLGDDENGECSLKNYYEYGAFGDFREQYEEAENRFGYNGEIFDPIGGQYYLRARYYNPVIGRFTQEDTCYGAGLNLYAYCRNLPVGYTDPSGHSAHSICENKYNKLKEKEANGTLTDAERKELKRYERAKNDPLYQLERETGQNSGQLYNKLKQEGYTRNKDGTWSDKNGKPVSLNDLRTKVKPKSGSSSVNLPEYDGKTTHGILVLDDGTQVKFTSGNGDPRYTNYANNGHVEQKASIYMNNNGISNATLYHNNTNGTCGWCNNMTATFLPEGATLTVIPPTNAVPNNSRAVAIPKTYVGNNKKPKTSKKYKGD